MEAEAEIYEGHRIEVRASATGEDAAPELLIDGEAVPFGQLLDGQYFLDEYAYDWQESLTDVARRLVDYRRRRHLILGDDRADADD